jgi:4-oxalomesaconate hydratase
VTRLLVFSAHAADFVWRAGGAIALTAQAGGEVLVLSLSYGERGESGELWKEPGQTEEHVKRIRHEQAVAACEALGAEFRSLDLGDYPLEVGRAEMDRVLEVVRGFKPNVMLTHTAVDPFNPDHPVAHDVTMRARQLASGAGVASAFERITPPAVWLFEPHQPELCGFVPNVFLDITPVFERKRAAMEAMQAQRYLIPYYTELAGRRANHARRISGDASIRYAEAHQRVTPVVTGALS